MFVLFLKIIGFKIFVPKQYLTFHKTNFQIWGCFLCIQDSLGIERQKKLKKFTILIRKLRIHVRILIYRA